MPTSDRQRTPVTLVTGLDRTACAYAANALATDGTVLISYDLRALADGQIIRQIRNLIDGERLQLDAVTLEHGCLTCTLRFDLLPLLRRLHHDGRAARIVVVLDPILEPEQVAAEIISTVVECDGLPPSPAGDDVTVVATVCLVDQESWLDAATGDITLHEAGLCDVEDERTVAQIAVGQVRFADALIVEGASAADSGYDTARLFAALVRLAPGAAVRTIAPHERFGVAEMSAILASLTEQSRRGVPNGVFDSLLDGCPPLEADCGVEVVTFDAERPFQTERLYEALDCLLEGVISARGRLWLASSNDDVVWLESAGGALQLSEAGRWLAARSDDELARVDPAVRAMAALRWVPGRGDRHTSIAVVVHRADADVLRATLRAALVTDVEIAGSRPA